MKSMKVVEFVADEWDAKTVPFLQIGDRLRGWAKGSEGDKTVVVAIVGNRFEKFYKCESELTPVERGE